jgi:hypothetical protein
VVRALDNTLDKTNDIDKTNAPDVNKFAFFICVIYHSWF